MANVKFTDLAPVVSLDGTELLAVVQPGNSSGTSKSATTQQIADLVNDPAIAAPYVLISAVPALNQARVLTGSANVTLTDAGPASTVTLNLSDTGVTATTYGDASHVAQLTIDAKGRVSSASNVAISVAAASIVVGTTTVTSGTTTRILYDNAGVLGEYAISGTGSVAMTTSPSFTTPALGTPSAVVLTSGTGLPISTGLTGLGTNVATALGVNVGSAGAVVVNGGALGTPSSGTLTNATGLPLTTGVTGVLPSANGGTGVNNGPSTITLGGSHTLSGAFASTFTFTGITNVTFPTSGTLATTGSTTLTVASTTIASGTTTRVLYDNAGVLGEYVISGSGSVAMTTSPVFTTPNLGTPSAATLTSATGLPISSGVSGLGTGIATALAVNTGSAGAPVLFNGAGGTPSSLTLTNATGLPIAGTTGYGTGVATALAVNVGSAGAFVTFNGALGTPSSGTLTNATGLPVAGGGTGAATFTTGGLLLGNGTSAVSALTTATAGLGVVSGASAAPTFQNNAVRAHILFDGTGTPAARGTPYNVTSITDNGTGDWTINFTSSLPSANYTFAVSCQQVSTSLTVAEQSNTTNPTTGAIRVFCVQTVAGGVDSAYMSVTCIGG